MKEERSGPARHGETRTQPAPPFFHMRRYSPNFVSCSSDLKVPTCPRACASTLRALICAHRARASWQLCRWPSVYTGEATQAVDQLHAPGRPSTRTGLSQFPPSPSLGGWGTTPLWNFSPEAGAAPPHAPLTGRLLCIRLSSENIL